MYRVLLALEFSVGFGRLVFAAVEINLFLLCWRGKKERKKSCRASAHPVYLFLSLSLFPSHGGELVVDVVWREGRKEIDVYASGVLVDELY